MLASTGVHCALQPALQRIDRSTATCQQGAISRPLQSTRWVVPSRLPERLSGPSRPPSLPERPCRRTLQPARSAAEEGGGQMAPVSAAPAATGTVADADADHVDHAQLPFDWARVRDKLLQILIFAAPVALVPLADPIQSLIDTLFLGRQPGAMLQLAALGPCSLILNFCNYSFAALVISTVSLVSDRLKRHPSWDSSSGSSMSSSLSSGAESDSEALAAGSSGDPGSNSSSSPGSSGSSARPGPVEVCEPAAQALSAALFLAVCGGLVVCGILQAWGPRLILATGADPVLLPSTLTYLRIRALAAPAALAMQVTQAGLLAQKDSLSPFRVVLVSFAVSLAGDMLLIGVMGMGLAGAAWTTALAQYVGVALLLRALSTTAVPARLALPSREALRSFLDTFGILTVFYCCKTSCYLMLQSTAARLTPLLLAAHQPIWQLWNLLAFTNTPLEQAALSFMPAADSRAERDETANLIVGLGAMNGVMCAALAAGLPALFPQLFVADRALWGPMNSVGLQQVLAMLCCGVDVSSTACLLALKDTGFVARAMAICLAILVAFLWWIRQNDASLGGVWWGLAAFFFLRACQSLPRLLGVTAFGRRQHRHHHHHQQAAPVAG